MKPTKQETTYEEGTYCYFDVNTWRKAHKEFHVEYDKLEDRPQMPPNLLTHPSVVPTQAWLNSSVVLIWLYIYVKSCTAFHFWAIGLNLLV